MSSNGRYLTVPVLRQHQRLLLSEINYQQLQVLRFQVKPFVVVQQHLLEIFLLLEQEVGQQFPAQALFFHILQIQQRLQVFQLEPKFISGA